MLYYRSYWISLGWLLVLTVWVASLLPVPEQINFKIDYFDKVEHVLAYFIMMSWFAQLYLSNITRNFYAVGFLLMGFVIEILQGMGSVRLFEAGDIMANSVGVLLAWWFIKDGRAKLFVRLEKRLVQ